MCWQRLNSRLWSFLGLAFVASLCYLGTPETAEASHFRGGTLSYVISATRTAKVTIDAYIRVGTRGGQGTLTWGDGSRTSFNPGSNTSQTLRRSVISHRYSRDNIYTASWGSCCWIGGVSNRSGSWTHSIKIRIRSGHKGGPQFNSPAYFTSCTNAPFIANMNGADPDRGRITYRAVGFPSGMTLNTSTGEVRWNSPRSGYHGFTVIGTSSASGATVHREVLLYIQGRCNNKPPTISLSPSTATVKGGQKVCTKVSASDPDRHRLSYVVTPTKSGATRPPSNQTSPNSWTWCWTPSKADEGTRHDILFTVLDNGNPQLNAQARFLITVSSGSPPTLTVSPSGTTKSVNEGSTLSFTVTAADPDGNGIASFTASGVPSFCTASKSGTRYSVTCRPGTTHGTRDYPITFTTTDRDGKPKTTSLRVTVRVLNVNRTPTISDPGSKTINEGQRLSFSLSASDPDGDRLTWSTSGVPSGASVTGSGNSRTFTWTPNYSQAGVYTVKFTVTDSGSPRRSFTRSVVITVRNVNRRPTIANPGNKTVAEGRNLSFTVSASDPDGNALTWSSSGLPSGARFSGSGTRGSFSWTPSYTQAGRYTVTFTVTDNGSPRLAASTTITITVTDNNRPAVWSGTTSYTINENQSLGAKTVTATDPDGDKLTYSLVSRPSGLTASVSGNGTSKFTVTFNWRPSYSQAGTYRVVFSAKDAKGAVSNYTVTIVVRNVNRPPVLTNPGSKTVREGTTLTFTITGSDPDGNAITWSYSGVPSGARITGTGNTKTFTWTPTYSQGGRYNVTFTVKDNGSPNLTATRTVGITVANTNRAPSLSNPGSKTVAENRNLSFSISGSDPDGNSLTWSVKGLPSGARVTGTGNSRSFSWTPSYSQAGTYTVTFTVVDNGSPALSASRAVVITVTDVNRGPSFTSKPPVSAIEDKLFTYRSVAVDPDGDKLTYSKVSGPTGSAVSSTGVVTWTPKSADAGKSFTFEIRVCDTKSACANQRFSIRVINVNDAPKITSKPVLVATEGKIYVYNPTFVDPDPGDSHVWSLVKGPKELNIDPKTGRLFWTPRPETAGKTYDVEIKICDAAGACDTQTYKITVRNVNNPPRITSIAPTVAIEGKTYTYSPVVKDDDVGDTHTWKILKAAPRMSFSTTTGRVTWNPGNTDVGKVYDVEIQVCDRAGACAKQAWRLSTRNTNNPPKITSRPPTTATENKLYSYSAKVSDPDSGDSHAWTLKKAPKGATIDARRGVVSWTPSDEHSGYTVTFQIEVCDSAAACDSQTWTVKVANVNDAPKITSTPPTRAVEKKVYTYNATAADPDPGEVLTWKLLRSARGAQINTSNGTVTWQPGLQDAGKVYDFEIQVCDKAGACDKQAWKVTVTNTNDAPTITSTPPTRATEGNTYNYGATASDPDPNDVLTWKLVTGPKGAILDSKTGRLTWKPGDADAGKDVDFVIEVCDAAGECDTQKWTVKVSNVNDAPKITSTPNTNATEGRLYSYSPTFEDKDANDTHTWRLLKSPRGSKINSKTGEVEWTPGAADAGKTVEFEIEICDQDRDCDTQKWKVTVRNTNGAPQITSKPGTSVSEGSTYTYNPTVSDSDPGDVHTWVGKDLPPGATINKSTGAISWKTSSKEAGKTYDFEIEVCDKAGLCDTQKWKVTVGNSNDAPTIIGSAPAEAYVGQKTSFSFKVEDNDPGDTHTWGFIKTHPGVSIDRATGTITWTPAPADAGKSFDFEIQVCDNGKPIKCAQKKFTISVKQRCVVDVNCSSGQICHNRLCIPANCTDKKPCKSGELCIAGKCQQDPCKTIQCASGEICRPTDGKCIQPCAGVACSKGQVCREGKCQADPCAATPCSSNEVCDSWTDPANPTCIKDPCDTSTCRYTRVCNQDGSCVDNPCGRMKCPSASQQCVAGECIERKPCQVDSDCPGSDVCVNDRCNPVGCYDSSSKCPSDKLCLAGSCSTDPCRNSSGAFKCGAGEFCRRNDGKCAKACANVQCPEGSQCVDGTCQVDACAKVRCAAGEVCIKGKCETDKCNSNSACKHGRVCNTSSNRCEDDPCAGVKCPDSKQVCKNGQCISPPSCILDKDCPDGKLCINGNCELSDCRKDSDCKGDELCVSGKCKIDSCKVVTCEKGKFCKAGKCIDSCASVHCEPGTKCVEGRCVADSCSGVTCPAGETCIGGVCVKDKCESFACRDGRICKGDRCVEDPCLGVTCPSGQKCEDGQCKGDLKCKYDNDCPGSGICVNGQCGKSDCYRQTCAEGNYCKDGKCTNNFCANRNCAEDEYCHPGTGKCEKTCPTCDEGKSCKAGACADDPCKGVTCKDDEYCKEGKCVQDDCLSQKGNVCKFRRQCRDGKCQDDACDNIKCADGQTCRDGICYGKAKQDEIVDEPEPGDGGDTTDGAEPKPEGGVAEKNRGNEGVQDLGDTPILASGGCDCNATGVNATPWFVALLFLMVGFRRRRRR